MTDETNDETNDDWTNGMIEALTRMPFRGFVDERPYPPTGLTTTRWKTEVDTMVVYFTDLWLTQDGVRIAPLFGMKDEHASADTYPHVVSWHGEMYLEDGHHRVVREALFGIRTMRMRVFVRWNRT